MHANTEEAVAEAANRFPDYPLFITGHSLGGGVAALLTHLTRQPGAAPERLQQTGAPPLYCFIGNDKVFEQGAVAMKTSHFFYHLTRVLCSICVLAGCRQAHVPWLHRFEHV